MIENQLTAKIAQINKWKREDEGFFFVTVEKEDFFANGRPNFNVGQVVTFLIDDTTKIKNARYAQIVRIEDTPAELAEAFAGVNTALTNVKSEVKDAKVLVREAIEKYKPLSPEEQLKKDLEQLAKVFPGLDNEKLFRLKQILAIEKLEFALVDYGFNRTN